jgi:uncharacterized protein YgbK (DUF1537 family)
VIRRIGIVADDLTGAGDAGLPFFRAGWRVGITTSLVRRPEAGTGVWVVDTESRHLSPSVAARRVGRAVRTLKAWGADFFYKKMDSTLRGNVGAEAVAFARAGGLSSPVMFCPAFPRAGRTVKGGRLYVEGRPLHRTAFARDPRGGITSSRVGVVLGKEGFAVPDVVKTADLARVARGLRGARGAVGSGGLAEALARLWPGNRQRRERRFVPAGSGTVVVRGSAHPRSVRQVEALRGKRESFNILEAPRRRGDPRRVLAALIARVDRRARRLVVTGGETAYRLARRRGVDRWTVVGEVERGAPVLFDGRALWATKPGGFGSDKTLVKAVGVLAKFSGRCP